MAENDPNAELKKKLDLDGSKFLNEIGNNIQNEANKFASKLISLKIDNPRLALEAYVVLIKYYITRGKKEYEKIKRNNFNFP